MRRDNPSPFLVALFNPLNLAMLVLILAAGLLSAWWLAPVGLVFWLVMFLVIFLNPGLRMSYKLKQREPLNQRFEAVFNRLEGVQMSLFNLLSKQPQAARRELRPVQEAVGQLVNRVYYLCSRMSVLEGHRVVSDWKRNPADELSVVKTRIEITDDPNLKKELLETQKALEEQIASMKSVSTLLEHVEAQLTSLSTSLEIKLTDVTRIAAQGPASIRTEAPRLADEIRELSNQLAEFEQAEAK